MSGLPPGDPQLVSMIVNHLKTQGLFDQFRRECLADVDTKPAYLNLKQRVDNFVSNHLSNHTWSPHLNKNQLRNNIRQLVLQSGMLEQGVDRIVAQVVDPKINHIFRPQVERVVREFLSPGSCSDEPTTPLPPADLKVDTGMLEQGMNPSPMFLSRIIRTIQAPLRSHFHLLVKRPQWSFLINIMSFLAKILKSVL
uniref:BOD1/SHG1 domain-containing protein n=1 Tax=Oryzias sinensis TaxID=183150 RepID=A0A8C7XXE6_9TELE